MPAWRRDVPTPFGSSPGTGRPLRRPAPDGLPSRSGSLQVVLPPGRHPPPRPAWRCGPPPGSRLEGGFRMAVNRSTPNMPRFERVKTPPCRSSSLSRPCPGPRGQVSQLPGNGAQPKPIRTSHHRHDQACVHARSPRRCSPHPIRRSGHRQRRCWPQDALSTPRRRPGSAATVKVTRDLSVAAPVFQILHNGQGSGHIRIDRNRKLRRLAHTGQPCVRRWCGEYWSTGSCGARRVSLCHGT
jgi:hypothetical protein